MCFFFRGGCWISWFRKPYDWVLSRKIQGASEAEIWEFRFSLILLVFFVDSLHSSIYRGCTQTPPPKCQIYPLRYFFFFFGNFFPPKCVQDGIFGWFWVLFFAPKVYHLDCAIVRRRTWPHPPPKLVGGCGPPDLSVLSLTTRLCELTEEKALHMADPCAWKRELKKNAKERKRNREIVVLKNDPEKLREEIKRLKALGPKHRDFFLQH